MREREREYQAGFLSREAGYSSKIKYKKKKREKICG
jgi:hypothetical protein